MNYFCFSFFFLHDEGQSRLRYSRCIQNFHFKCYLVSLLLVKNPNTRDKSPCNNFFCEHLFDLLCNDKFNNSCDHSFCLVNLRMLTKHELRHDRCVLFIECRSFESTSTKLLSFLLFLLYIASSLRFFHEFCCFSMASTIHN